MKKNYLLEDSDWLKNKYIIERKSTEEIAKLLGYKKGGTVSEALKKFNIEIRNKSERRKKENDFFILNLPVINGSLLGDSFITKQLTKNGNCGLSKKNINYDHLLYFSSKILKFSPEKRISGPIEPPTNLTVNGKPYYFLNTFKHLELTELRKKWYPYDIKIIPRDILLTKESLLHWFLDDGFSYRFKDKYKNKEYSYVRIFLCTNGFSKSDLEWICDKLKTEFKLIFTLSKKGLRKDGSQSYQLKLSQSQTNYFFDLIGECPVDSMKYKWKRV